MLLCFGVDTNMFTVPCLALIRCNINLSLSCSPVPRVKLFPLDLAAGMTLYSPKYLPWATEFFLMLSGWTDILQVGLLLVLYIIRYRTSPNFNSQLPKHVTPSQLTFNVQNQHNSNLKHQQWILTRANHVRLHWVYFKSGLLTYHHSFQGTVAWQKVNPVLSPLCS